MSIDQITFDDFTPTAKSSSAAAASPSSSQRQTKNHRAPPSYTPPEPVEPPPDPVMELVKMHRQHAVNCRETHYAANQTRVNNDIAAMIVRGDSNCTLSAYQRVIRDEAEYVAERLRDRGYDARHERSKSKEWRNLYTVRVYNPEKRGWCSVQ